MSKKTKSAMPLVPPLGTFEASNQGHTYRDPHQFNLSFIDEVMIVKVQVPTNIEIYNKIMDP